MKLPRRQQVVTIGIQIHTLILYELINGREMARLKHLGAFHRYFAAGANGVFSDFEIFEQKHPI